MAFSVPTFNLLCDVWQGPWIGKVRRLKDVPCNLALGRRVQQGSFFIFDDPGGFACPNLLLPAGTDVRDEFCGGSYDLVEVPSGTGRWYSVGIVDDVAKGFDNEYRMASIRKVAQISGPGNFPGLWWPVPIP